MCNSENYILLSHKGLEGDSEEKWFISYKGGYFLCENNANDKIVKLKNVENFIKIWYIGRKDTLVGKSFGIGGSIWIVIADIYFSGHSYDRYKEISLDIIREYIFQKKDIIDEKRDNSIHKVNNRVGGYCISNQSDKED